MCRWGDSGSAEGQGASHCASLPRRPLTGHRHRPPQSQWCSRTHWSHGVLAPGLEGSPACAGRSPARHRPSSALSLMPPSRWPRYHLTETTHKRGPPQTLKVTQVSLPSPGGKCVAFIPTSPLTGCSQKPTKKGPVKRDGCQAPGQSWTLSHTCLFHVQFQKLRFLEPRGGDGCTTT